MTASARDRYEAKGAAWEDGGRAVTLLLDGYELIALRCWIASAGARAGGVSERLRAFLTACERAQPDDWLDAYLSERERCQRCGESYRFENVTLCTHCGRTWCYRCAALAAPADNGNPGCACGGELVG